MTPPPLLTEEENRLLSALAMMVQLDETEAKSLMWQLPFKGRAWRCAMAICSYTRFPIDRFSRAVAKKKHIEALKTVFTMAGVPCKR